MSDRDLDRLIHTARGAEAPSAAQRTQVREGLARRIASGEALPDLDGPHLSPLRARAWLHGTSALPLGLGGLAVAALAAYALGRDVPGEATRGVAAATASPAAADRAAADRGAGSQDAAAVSSATIAPTATRSTASDPPATASAASRPSIGPASNAPARASASAGTRGPVRAATPSAARAPSIDHEAERRALARVQHALRDGQFADAIAGLDRDDRAFAGGALQEERAAARVLARCGSGDAAEAQQLATAFVARYPGSPLRSRVLASCPSSAGKRAP